MEDSRFTITRNLLDLKADVDLCDNLGRTMLHKAAIEGDVDMTKFLLTYKANINTRNIGGFTPVHYAQYMSSINSIIDTIYDRDKPNTINNLISDEHAPIHLAIDMKDHAFEAVEFLLDNKADVNLRTSNGLTPLLQLIKKDNPNQGILLLLINSKAHIHLHPIA